MSRIGKIGSFIRNTAQGVAELISAPFLSAQPASATRPTAAKERLLASYPPGAEIGASAVAAASDPTVCAEEGAPASEAGGDEILASEFAVESAPTTSGEERPSASEADHTETPEAAGASKSEPADSAGERLLASGAGDAEIAAAAATPAPVNEPVNELINELKGRVVSDEPFGPEFPASAVTRRYRALKAEGLTPKQASEFSHSAKKYAQYRTLSATRPYEGAETYWEALKDFDQKAEAHMQRLKQAAVLKQEILISRREIARARDLLIQKFVDGKEALAADNFALIKKVAETIDARYF